MDTKSLALGVALILLEVSLALFVLKNRKPRISLIAIIGVGICIRIFSSLDPNLHTWDECYHALVSKNFSNNLLLPRLFPLEVVDYDYKNWTNNYVWLHKPPLTFWVIAYAIKIFGCHTFVVRIPSIIFSTISIYLIYRISRHFTTVRISLLATFLFSINGLLIDLCAGRTATDHVDTLFHFLILLGAFLSIKDAKKEKIDYKSIALIGLITGLAVLTKWLTGFFILIIYFFSILFEKKGNIFDFRKTAIAFIISLIVATPWNVYIFFRFPSEFLHEQLYNIQHVYSEIEGHNQPFWYFIDRARINWNELIYLHTIIFVHKILAQKKSYDYLLIVWAGIPYIVFSLTVTKMPAYIIISSAAVFIIIAQSIYYIKKNWMRDLVLIATMSLGIRYSIERIKPFDFFKKVDVVSVNPILKYGDNNTIIFGCENNIETMFRYNVIAYERLPTEKELEELKSRIYKLYVFDKINLPPYIKSNKFLMILESPKSDR